MKNICIIAGEASGDLHCSNLVRELLKRDRRLWIWGIAGPRSREAGMHTEYDISQMAFLGFSEIVRHLPFIKKVSKTIRELIRKRKPGLIILIDYPGFNLRLARFAHKRGISVLYYISPQIWAWGKNRVKKIARFVDYMAVIFPFEEDFYRMHKVPVLFVGHPLLESLKISQNRYEFFKKYGFRDEDPLLALFPGSREQEVNRILPGMLDVSGGVLQSIPRCQLAVSKAATLPNEVYERWFGDRPVTLISEPYSLMAYSTAMIVASGTATVESALIGTPFVVVYKVSPFTYWLGKRLIQVDHLAMANIILQERLVPEFIQKDFCPENVTPVLLNLLQDEEARKKMKDGFKKIRKKLGQPGASGRVAELALRLMRDA